MLRRLPRAVTFALLLAVLAVAVVPTARLQAQNPPQGAPVTITLAYNRFLTSSFGPGPAPLDVIKQAVAARYPNIQIQLNLMPDSVNISHDALAVWITAKDPTIDLYGMDTPWVLEFGKAGWAAPLNERVPELQHDFLPSGLDVFSYQGQRLGVPFWGSVSGLFYRKDLLEANGLRPPETYDDLTAAARAVTAKQPGLSGFVWEGAKEESLVMVWAEFLHGFGGRYVDDSGKCAFNSPQGVAATEYMVQLIDQGTSPRETPAWTSAEAQNRFVEGKAVFLRHNLDIVTWLDQADRSSVVGKWGFMANPAQPGGKHTGVTGGFAFAVNPYTDNMDEAMQVLQVIAGRDVQKGFAIAWGPVQYYKGLYDDPEVTKANPNVGLIAPVLDTAAPRPPSTHYAELSSILQDEIHSALTHLKPAKQAMDDACARVEPLEK